MKEVEKERLIVQNVSKYLFSEIELMMRIDHPNVIRLYYYFENEVHVYLILELATNGHLYRRLRLKGVFLEVEALSVS